MSLSLERRINAFTRLGDSFKMIAKTLMEEQIDDTAIQSDILIIQRQTSVMNPWFSKENIAYAFDTWAGLLSKEGIEKWLKGYELSSLESTKTKSVALINAGNIPLVGFHDFLSVLLAGHKYIAKNSSDDKMLLPYVASLLIQIEPGFKELITFTERLSGFDAVIATGSDNSSRYFNYYFGKYPHIIRKNRNSVVVLDGTEDEEFFKSLSEDVFSYYGLGCRNVSKMYVPEKYDFDLFFKSIYHRNEVMMHNKYMNNFEHHNAILLLKQIPFLQNGFLIVLENEQIASPVAIIHFEYYSNESELKTKLIESKEKIQCIVTQIPSLKSQKELNSICISSGQSQQPGLCDYADGVDTMEFLLSLED